MKRRQKAPSINGGGERSDLRLKIATQLFSGELVMAFVHWSLRVYGIHQRNWLWLVSQYLSLPNHLLAS